jgi:hypothetical protein
MFYHSLLIIKYSLTLICNRNRSKHRTKLTVVIQRVWCIHRTVNVIDPDTAPLFVTQSVCIAVPVPWTEEKGCPAVTLKYMYFPFKRKVWIRVCKPFTVKNISCSSTNVTLYVLLPHFPRLNLYFLEQQ